MIHGLKAYPAYKSSGLPWLGTIPEHWVIARAKNLFRCVDVRSETGEEELLTVSSEYGVVPRRSTSVTMFKAESYVGYKLCWPGDLVINSLWAWARGLGVSSFHGIISTAYGVYRVKQANHLNARFIHELVRSIPFLWELRVRSKGVWTSRLQLTDESFLGSPLPVPPSAEQTAIVRFLDHVDRRIRRYVRTKQKLIHLLEEQRQAIIHRAVTRGLDPSVRLKPSRVEWLGEVPDHWEMRRLKSLVLRIDQGVSPQADNYLADDGSWGVLKAGCVNHGVFREHEHKRLPADFTIDPTIVVNQGDVLVSRACGSPQLVGSVGRVPSLAYRLILSDKIFRTAFNAQVEPDYMVFAMNSRHYRQQVERAISGAEGLANNLPLSALRAFIFAIPPLLEQQQITHYLRERLLNLTAAAARAEREIALLFEYRTCLIANVVTGKLDVREAAARLPDEVVEESDPFDETDALSDTEGDPEVVEEVEE